MDVPSIALLAAGFELVLQILLPVIFIVLPLVAQLIKHFSEKENPAEPIELDDENEFEDAQVNEEIRQFLRQTGQLDEPPMVEAPVMAEAVQQSVSDHVASHLGGSVFDERSERLGTVGHAAEELQDHVHDVFDHRLGQFESTTESAAPEFPDEPEIPEIPEIPESPHDEAARKVPSQLLSPQDIADMLRDGQSIRKAIILNEILTPPENRWS